MHIVLTICDALMHSFSVITSSIKSEWTSYNTIQAPDGLAPVLEHWGMRTFLWLLLLLYPLCSRVVVSVRVKSMGHIDQFKTDYLIEILKTV